MSVLPEKTPLEALELIKGGALMIDVRERDEIAKLAYDVEGILVFPMSEAQARIEELPKDRDIVWACRSGNRSRQVGQALYSFGLTRAVNMNGGIIEWEKLGLPVIAGAA